MLPPPAPLSDLAALLSGGGRLELSDGAASVPLPPEVADLLRRAVAALESGVAVSLNIHRRLLTTWEAADLLGVSRPTLVKLLDAGEIPYSKPGSHRRIRLEDVLEFRRRRAVESRSALDRLSALSEELGLYDLEPGQPG